ncbi:glycosyltransferase family 2 protein [Endothiovibrio diazotrophicus]
MEVSVVIPVFNSEEALPELCRQLWDALDGREFEVILVNDGSADRSWEVIERLSREFGVVGVCLARNFGQDNAIMAGLGRAVGASVVIMDDDLQHSPYDIPLLLAEVERGADVCYADYSRHKRQAWWKNLGSHLNSKQAEYLIGKPGEIYLSPFKAIRRIVVDSVIQYEGPYPYVDGLIFRATSAVTQVHVEHRARDQGKSNYNLRRSLSVFFKHTTGFSVAPLRIASLIGLLSALFGFVLGTFYIYDYFTSEVMIEGWTTLVALLLFLGGMTLMSLGLIGEYLGRMYLTVNRRPQYVIRKVAR